MINHTMNGYQDGHLAWCEWSRLSSMYDYDTVPGCESFSAFYLQYREMIFGVAVRILQNPNEAEDVVQTTFLKAWLKPASFRGGNIESWLTTLAKHAAIDVIRKRSREAALVPLELLPDRRDTSDVAEEALLRLQCRWVADEVALLPVTRKALLMASFWDGTSHERIAALACLPLGTVKTRIRSSLSHLRKQARLANL